MLVSTTDDLDQPYLKVRGLCPSPISPTGQRSENRYTDPRLCPSTYDVQTKDFVVTGLPVSLIGLAGIGTIGYVLVNLLM